ncbi:MAG: T9SS type A sorting domain-containing protein [Bacteroidia bacterium]
MKKIVCIAFVLFVMSSKAQIPNSGFETWVTNTETPQHYLVPQNWVTIDMDYSFGNPSNAIYSVVRTTQSHSGTYAVLMQTATNANGDTIWGGLFSCNSLADFNNTDYGFPFTARPAFFQGYYKFTSVGGDVALAFVTLTKWNTATHKQDTIAQAYFGATVNATSYTQFSIPLAYSLNNEYPDTAQIQTGIGFTGNGAHMGTLFYLDDLGFSGSVPLGIQQFANNNEQVSIYPNPAKEIINVELGIMNETATLQITDMLGNTVKQFIIYNSAFQISTVDLAEGVYQFIIHNSAFTITKKVVIVR